MTQPTEPIEVTQADIEARRKLFDGYVIHQQSLYDSTARAFAAHRVAAERAALDKYQKSLDVPELVDFAKGVVIEAQHQRQRWGDNHDLEKEPEDWFWTVGYLCGKALQAQRTRDWKKFRHHLITGAAIMANWHARVAQLEAPVPDPQTGEK